MNEYNPPGLIPMKTFSTLYGKLWKPSSMTPLGTMTPKRWILNTMGARLFQNRKIFLKLSYKDTDRTVTIQQIELQLEKHLKR